MTGITLHEGWIDASSGRALLWVSLGDVDVTKVEVDQVRRVDGTSFTVSDISATPITGIFYGPKVNATTTHYLWVELGDISGEVDVSGSVRFSSKLSANITSAIVPFHAMPAALVIHGCGFQMPNDSPIRIFPAVSPQDLAGYSFYSNRLLGSGPIDSSGVDDIIVFEESEVPESIMGIGFDANGTPTGISDSVPLTPGIQSIYAPITILSDVTWDASGYHFDISCNVPNTNINVYPYLEVGEQSGAATQNTFYEAGMFSITIASNKWTPFVRIEASSSINNMIASDPIVESVLGYRPFTAGETIDVRSVIGDPVGDAITVHVGIPAYPVYAYEIYVAEKVAPISVIGHADLEAKGAFDEYVLVSEGNEVRPSVVTIRARDASDEFIDVSANVAWLPPVPKSPSAWVDYDGSSLTMGWSGAFNYVSDISSLSIMDINGITLLTTTDFGMEGTTFIARFGPVSDTVLTVLQNAVYRQQGGEVHPKYSVLTVVTSNAVGNSSYEFSIDISPIPLGSSTPNPTTGLLTVQIHQPAIEPPIRRIRVGENAFAYPDVSRNTTVIVDISYNPADFLSVIEFGNAAVTRTKSVITGPPPTPTVYLSDVSRNSTTFAYTARVGIPGTDNMALSDDSFTWSVYDASSGGNLIPSTFTGGDTLEWTSAPTRLSEVWVELSGAYGVATRAYVTIPAGEHPVPWGLVYKTVDDVVTWKPIDTAIVYLPYRLIDVSTGEVLYMTTELSVSVNELPMNRQIVLVVDQAPDVGSSDPLSYYVDIYRNREAAPGPFQTYSEISATGSTLMFGWQHNRVNSESNVRYRFYAGGIWINKYDTFLGGGLAVPASILPAQFVMKAYRFDGNGDEVPYSESVESAMFDNTGNTTVVIGTEMAPTALALSADGTLSWSETTAQTFYPKKYNVYADGALLTTVTSPSLPPWELVYASAVYTVTETNGEDESPPSVGLPVDGTPHKNRVDAPIDVNVEGDPRKLVWGVNPSSENPNTATLATVYYKKPDGTFDLFTDGIPVNGHVLCSALLPGTHKYAVTFRSDALNSESSNSYEIEIEVELEEVIAGPTTTTVTETSVRATIEAANTLLAGGSSATVVKDAIRTTVQKLTNPVITVEAFPAASFLTRVNGISSDISIESVKTTILAPPLGGSVAVDTSTISVGDLIYIMAEPVTTFGMMVDDTQCDIVLQAGGVLVNGVLQEPGDSFMIGTMPVVYSGTGSAGFSRTGGGGGGGGAICFLGNAPVLTPSGYRRIDSLHEGDLVQTADGRAVAIQRAVHQRVTASAAVNPYIIERGQFGATKRLLISPEHRVAVAGRGLVEARHLGLQQEERTGTLDYYNLELPDWQADNLVVAGVEVESLAPVRRVVITHAMFRQMVAQQYGAMTPAVQAKILKTCKFLPGGRVEVPTIRR